MMKQLIRRMAMISLCCTSISAAQSLQTHNPTDEPDTRLLHFDFPGIQIGVAEYPQGPTGTTVFYFPQPVQGAIDVRGGAPGVVNSEALRLQRENEFIDAICFAGGSSYGLSAATGVANAIKEQRIESGDSSDIAFVGGAIIYDVGLRRLNMITPDDALGRAAFASIRTGIFPLGPHGAGRMAMQGWVFGGPQHSGQGGAFRQVGDTKVAVFTIVNPAGTVVDREGNIVRCGLYGETDCGPVTEALDEAIDYLYPKPEPATNQGTTSNTTLTLVVTNEKLSPNQLQRLAIQVHTSMARAIQPFSTGSDGDVLFAVTTGDVETEGLGLTLLSVIASQVAWDAVLSSVPALKPQPSRLPVEWTTQQMDEAVGRFEFAPDVTLEIKRQDDNLIAILPGKRSLYFTSGEEAQLIPVGTDTLMLPFSEKALLKLIRKDAAVTGISLNPGRWEQHGMLQTSK